MLVARAGQRRTPLRERFAELRRLIDARDRLLEGQALVPTNHEREEPILHAARQATEGLRAADAKLPRQARARPQAALSQTCQTPRNVNQQRSTAFERGTNV